MSDLLVVSLQAQVQAPVEKVWEFYTAPEHVTHWNFASDNWHCPHAENNLKSGGKFTYRMEAVNESVGFDFCGTFNTVKENQLLEYTIEDGRKVEVHFADLGTQTQVTVEFEAEQENPVDMQRDGWQAILNNFKKYVETSV